jgi:hypothetical protein
MTKLEKTSKSTERLLQEAAALCAVNHISESEAAQIFSEAFQRARSHYELDQPEQPEIFSAAQVLSEWHQNPAFLAPDGTPRPLSIASTEFANLCHSTGTTTDSDHILELLSHSGAIKKIGDKIIAARREIIIGDSHPAAAARAVRLAASFLSTLKHNLTRNVREAPRFERTVAIPFFSERHIPSLLAYLSVHAQSFLEDLDAWMATRTGAEDGTEVGVGIYFFRRNT